MLVVNAFTTNSVVGVIGLGRHNNIEVNLRKCNECGNDVGDECHYLFICDYLKEERFKFIHGSYYKKPSVHAFAHYNVNSFKQEDYQIDNIC